MIEIKTLEEAKAAAFRGAYRGLKSQGWQKSLSKSGAMCVYRGRGGRACAVGWILAVPPKGNSVYVRAAIRSGAKMSGPLQRWYDGADARDRDRLLDFLGGMQNRHDSAPGPEAMESRMREFAKRHGIALPSECQ